ncbi:hypothetical protein GCM10009775_02800 [Microbacterium aoyamense]|uniref:Uncharacterized protein n=1 Tax=Microbacterium aoyamense TaxID=344166 RepID=A0ABN2P630_9MICO|nr:hypothetical protein [Microbacterium aoyamense]
MSTTELKINEIRWNDGREGYSLNRLHVIDPASTDVAAVKKIAEKVTEAHVAFKKVERERQAAHVALERADEDARIAARNAAREGKPVKPKEIKKLRAAAREAVEDLDLAWEGALGGLESRRDEYIECVAHNTPALRAEGLTALDSAILSVASASQIALRAEATMTGALGLLGMLSSGDFTPAPMKAARREMGEAGAPAVHVDLARTELAKAVGYAAQILEQVKEAVKEAEKAARMQAEADESDDLDDENDPEDDDEGEDLTDENDPEDD